MIFGHGETQRHETLFQHRDVAKVLRKGDYKLIVGNAGEYDGWWSNSGQPEISIKYKEPNDTVGQIVCSLGLCGGLGDYITLDDGTRIRLYNIREDMSETQNIAEDNMDIVKGTSSSPLTSLYLVYFSPNPDTSFYVRSQKPSLFLSP